MSGLRSGQRRGRGRDLARRHAANLDVYIISVFRDPWERISPGEANRRSGITILALGGLLAVILEKPQTIAVKRIPIPPVPGRTVRVEMRACGLCGTDLAKRCRCPGGSCAPADPSCPGGEPPAGSVTGQEPEVAGGAAEGEEEVVAGTQPDAGVVAG